MTTTSCRPGTPGIKMQAGDNNRSCSNARCGRAALVDWVRNRVDYERQPALVPAQHRPPLLCAFGRRPRQARAAARRSWRHTERYALAYMRRWRQLLLLWVWRREAAWLKRMRRFWGIVAAGA